MFLKHSKGLTLIEILVSLLILAIGLLGLAALNVSGLRYNHSAFLRTQATFMAYEIADRMRANTKAANDGNYNIGLGDPPPGSLTDCTTSSCTAAQMANYDKVFWKCLLGKWETSAICTNLCDKEGALCKNKGGGQKTVTFLPSGDGSVSRSGNVFTITIQWDDTRGQGNPKAFVFKTEL